MNVFAHARDPLLSVWQSAVETVFSPPAGGAGRAAAPNPFVAATNAVVTALDERLKAAPGVAAGAVAAAGSATDAAAAHLADLLGNLPAKAVEDAHDALTA